MLQGREIHDTVVELLAARYRVAYDKITKGHEAAKVGRTQWIEGTLELAAIVLEARERRPNNQVFGAWFQHWIEQHKLPPIGNNDRAALVNFAKDPITARALLEQTHLWSWHHIWEQRPGHRPIPRVTRQPDQPGKTQPEPKQRQPTRKPPPSERPLKDLSKLFLKPEQIDPNFKGTPLEFAAKYGHVPLHTKEQIEHNKQQQALSAFLGAVSNHERTGREALKTFEAVDQSTLADWLAKPSKAEKLRSWVKSIEVVCKRLHDLISDV